MPIPFTSASLNSNGNPFATTVQIQQPNWNFKAILNSVTQ